MKTKEKKPTKTPIQRSVTNFWDQNFLKSYIQEVDKINTLTREEEDRLSRRMAEGDMDARNSLIQANLRFVVSIAKNYMNKGVPFLDLINEGNIGLILACDKFDYRRGYRFISYAVWWVRQYIAKAFAEQLGLIRLPMNRALQHFKIKSMMQENQEENSSNYAKIAKELNLKKSEMDSILQATRKYVSLDTPINVNKGDKKTIFLEDVLLDTKTKMPEEEMLDHYLQESINEHLSVLSKKEQMVITYRFGLNGMEALSLSEIGRKFDVTKERIRQIEKRAIKRLKQVFSNQSLKDFMAA